MQECVPLIEPLLKPVLGKRKIDQISEEPNVWTVKTTDEDGLREFQLEKGVQEIEKVLTLMKEVSEKLKIPNLWDNYGYREYSTTQFIKIQYKIEDLIRCPGRSGPDCSTKSGNKENIEIKTTTFNKSRTNLTAKYGLGQFARQDTVEIRDFARSLDGVAYVVFIDHKCTPAFIIYLHGKEAMEAHSRLLEQKQNAFLAKKQTGAKGGRDSVSVQLIDLCQILTLDGGSPLSGFEAWTHGKQIVNWKEFVDKINNGGISLRIKNK